jgi:hypothetical protein
MTLDQRASQAAEGLKSAVSGHPLLLMNPAPQKPPMWSRALSFAGAFALVAVIGFMMIQTNMFASDDDETAATTTTSTVATTTTVAAPPTTIDGPTPVLPPEGGGEKPVDPDPPAASDPVDVTPPALAITSPADGDRLKEKVITFAGTTEPGATVAAGPYQASVKSDGSWSIVLNLNAGGNRATFTATDAAGNSSEASISVFYDPPETTTKPAGEWAFTANATYGECELSPPYDEYYGTAAPGTKILVTSDFGSGSTFANAEGQWWVKVVFKTAPYGKVFSVRVKNETTFEKLFFEFVSWAG